MSDDATSRSESDQDPDTSQDEDVQIDLAWSTEEQSQFSPDDLLTSGYQPEPDTDDQNYA